MTETCREAWIAAAALIVAVVLLLVGRSQLAVIEADEQESEQEQAMVLTAAGSCSICH